METYIIWGYILTMSVGGMPPIVDPNYKTEQDCNLVKDAVLEEYPNYQIWCNPVWKPDKTTTRHHVVHRKRTNSRRGPAHQARTARSHATHSSLS
jgi:hypothetical protein